MDIYKYADVSTGHMKQEDSELLHDLGDARFPMSVAEYEHGFFIPLPTLEDFHDHVKADLLKAGMSDAFCNLCEHCIKAGCFVIRLDTDGGDIEELPKFDW